MAWNNRPNSLKSNVKLCFDKLPFTVVYLSWLKRLYTPFDVVCGGFRLDAFAFFSTSITHVKS